MTVSRRLQLLVYLGIAIFVARPAAGQATGTVTGAVRSAETGAPLIAAVVQVMSADGGRVASSITNPSGRYVITSVPAGSYTVRVTTTGFETTESPVTIGAGQSATVDFNLTPQAIDLDPVTVTASRREERALDAPARVEVINPQIIEETPALQPVDHLRNVAGVDIVTQNLQSTNVVARGFNNVFSGALLALTDHRIAAIPSLRVNALHLVPANNEDIERIEVVLGPGSALYGPNTANGVMHIFTRSPLSYQGTTVTTTFGQRDVFHGTFRTAHLLGESLGLKLSGEYLTGDDWEYDDPTEVQARNAAIGNDPNTRIGLRNFDAERWAVDARLDWRITEDATAILSAGSSTSLNGIELTGIGASQVKDWTYNYYQARFNWGRLFAQAYLNTSDAGETYLLRDGSPSIDNSRFAVAQVQHGYSPRLWQDFTYGIDYLRTMPDTEGTIHGRYENEDEYSEVGVFLQSETKLTDRLDLVLAGRLDRHSVVEETVFSPRAALVFKPNQEQTLRFSYNRAYSNPGSVQLFLDLNSGPIGEPTLGGLGYNIRAAGTGFGGIRFQTDEGGYVMRSPGGPTPGTLIDVNATNVWNAQLNSFATVLTDLRGIDPGLVNGAIAALNAAGMPDGGVWGLNPVTGAAAPFVGPSDVPGIRESRNTTYELGYSGLFGGRLLLAADFWYSQRDNFISALIPQAGFAFIDPAAVYGFAEPVINDFLQGIGLPSEMADSIANEMATGLRSVPGGVVSPADFPVDHPALFVSYRNFGDIDLWGTDLSAQALFGNWNAAASLSLVSDDHFETEGQIITLNAPARKATASLGYRNDDIGFNGNLRMRYNAEFPVNSGVFIGMGCVTTVDPEIDEGCVDSFTLADLTLGYDLPQIRGASLQLTVQNLFDTGYRSFVGAPTIGRMALLRLKYDF